MKTFTTAEQIFLTDTARTIENAIGLVEAREIGSHLGEIVRHEILNMLRYYRWSVENGSTPLATAQAAREFINNLNPSPEKPVTYKG